MRILPVRTCALALVVAMYGADQATPQATTRDIPYAPVASERQRLDLYVPDVSDAAPVILVVHGGSLTSGGRAEPPWPQVCAAFARAGFLCASTGYRLFPAVNWPVPVEDVAAAAAWLSKNAAAHGGDPSRITLVGHSSGCLLVTLVNSNPALLGAHGLRPADLLGTVGFGCRLASEMPDTAGVPPERIAAAFDPGGRMERFVDLETLATYYPMRFVGAHMGPYLAVLGDGERFKPPILEDGAKYVGLARDCEVDADLVILEDRTHMTAVEKMVSPDDPAFRLVVDFVERLTREGPRSHLADPDRCPSR